MKNFIVFIVVASALAFGGYFAYQVYYLGEKPQDVWSKMTGSGQEDTPDHLTLGREAWDEERYGEAAKHYEDAKAAYLAGDRDERLEEEADVEKLYVNIARAWARAYKASGYEDEEAKQRALDAAQLFLDNEKWADSPRRRSAMSVIADVNYAEQRE